MKIAQDIGIVSANSTAPISEPPPQPSKPVATSAPAASSAPSALVLPAPSDLILVEAPQGLGALGTKLGRRAGAAVVGFVGGFGLSTFVGAASGKMIGVRVGNLSARAVKAGATWVGVGDSPAANKAVATTFGTCLIAGTGLGFAAGAMAGPAVGSVAGFLGLIGKLDLPPVIRD